MRGTLERWILFLFLKKRKESIIQNGGSRGKKGKLEFNTSIYEAINWGFESEDAFFIDFISSGSLFFVLEAVNF